MVNPPEVIELLGMSGDAVDKSGVGRRGVKRSPPEGAGAADRSKNFHGGNAALHFRRFHARKRCSDQIQKQQFGIADDVLREIAPSQFDAEFCQRLAAGL